MPTIIVMMWRLIQIEAESLQLRQPLQGLTQPILHHPLFDVALDGQLRECVWQGRQQRTAGGPALLTMFDANACRHSGLGCALDAASFKAPAAAGKLFAGPHPCLS